MNFKGDPMKEQGCPRYRSQKYGPNEWKALHQMRGLNEDCLKGGDQSTDITETTNGTLQTTKGKAKERVRRVVKRQKRTRTDLLLQGGMVPTVVSHGSAISPVLFAHGCF